jgi:hypothetical protein
MRKIALIICMCFATSVFACNPKQIKEQSDGSFSYPLDCHLEFGRLVKNEKEREKQIEHLNKSIELKDLAIDVSNERIELWQKTAYKMEDRLLKYESSSEKMRWIYFGLGVIVMGAAVNGAGKLR